MLRIGYEWPTASIPQALPSISILNLALIIKDERTEPWNRKQTHSEEEVKQEQHDSGYQTCGMTTIPDCAGQDSHARTLSDHSEKHQLPTTEPVKLAKYILHGNSIEHTDQSSR